MLIAPHPTPHLVHLALPRDLVVVTDLVDADDLAQHGRELVKEGLGHVLEVAGIEEGRNRSNTRWEAHTVERRVAVSGD